MILGAQTPPIVAVQPTRPPAESCLGTTLYVLARDATFRRTLRDLLASIGHPVLLAADPQQLLAEADPQAPGCVIAELYLQDRTAMDLCADLERAGLALPTIIIADQADPECAVEAMRRGAFDLMVKPLSPTRLLDSVLRAVNHGHRKLDTAQTLRVLARRYEQLTYRERQVLLSIVHGQPNKAIAAELRISLRTIETHRKHIMHKLGANSLAELVRMAVLLLPHAFSPLSLAG